MMRPLWIGLLAIIIGLVGCGGNGSSNPPAGTGSVTVLIGDGPLENVDAVFIDVGRVVLLGAGGQVVLTEDATPDPLSDPINLLELRNVTELLLSEDVPAGTYSKIRLYIDSLEIVEDAVGDEPMPGEGTPAQLPANGKIDLNPQGNFVISPGEDLVLQIDVDLDRSVHTVLTGNSRYRFRPVVFVDVLDQRANLRLTRLFGTAQAVTDQGFDLCRSPTEPDACYAVRTDAETLMLTRLTDDLPLADEDQVHAFGHFATGGTGGTFFDALVVAQGAEDTVTQIEGSLMVSGDGAITTIGGIPVAPVAGALQLDGFGNPVESVVDGQPAEAWAQVDPSAAALPDPLPSFLTQIGTDLDEESVEGSLAGISGGSMTLLTDEAVEVCVTAGASTEIQSISGWNSDANVELISLTELAALANVTNVVAFGTFDDSTPACLEARVIVVESEA